MRRFFFFILTPLLEIPAYQVMIFLAWIYPFGFGLSRGDTVAGYSVHKGPLFLLA